MLTFLRRFLILLLGIALIGLPAIVREQTWGYNNRSYTPPAVPETNFAATPLPTVTPVPIAEALLTSERELRAGPVVVDFAHYSYLNPASLQPLADALATRGVGLRYWLSKVDTMALEVSAAFPDQSEDLAKELKDASALIVISPFFLWTPEEIALAERFVADGGRLFMVSDPDIMGDYPSLLNILAEPFGVVFHDDYLYDTQRNDGNYTFFFQEPATDETETLTDAEIAFYGGRSISGAISVQMRSSETTLSSLRVGQSGFATVAIGGVAERGTQGRVLALSDFDVLSDAYRVRHDNQRMVDYVADFLSGDQRINTMADFPSYFGKEVELAYGSRSAINANLLAQGAQLQTRLEATGRTLMLTTGSALTTTTTVDEESAKDLIYLADYVTADAQTTLLTDLGLTIITEVVTVTTPVEVTPVTPAATPTSEPAADDEADETSEDDSASEDDTTGEETVPLTRTIVPRVTPTVTLTVVPEVTPAVTPTITPAVPLTRTTTSATATTTPLTVTATLSTAEIITTSQVAPRVEITTYLETADGLRLLAEETVLVAQLDRADGSLLLAVLGANRRGIDAGVARLLNNDFSSCVVGPNLTYCSLPAAETTSSTSSRPTPTPTPKSGSGSSSGSSDENGGSGDEGDDDADPTPPPSDRSGILLIDDNRSAGATETSEADLYLQTLVNSGHDVDLWSIEDQEAPTAEDMSGYAWVIWSNGGYEEGKLTLEDMDLVFGYVRLGGHLTISSRFPLPGIEEAAPLVDVVVDSEIPELVDGLPTDPISLAEEQSAANLTPLAADESNVQIALRRGPDSENAEAPVLVILTDTAESELDSRLMLLGMAIEGLPEETGTSLINNMATWMLGE